MKIFNCLLIILGGIEYIIYFICHDTNNIQLIEAGLGIILFLLIFTGTLNSYNLLKINGLPKIDFEKTVSFSSEQFVARHQQDNSGKFILTSLIIALFSFIVGMLINRKSK